MAAKPTLQTKQPTGSKTTLLLAVLGGLAFGGGGASAWFLLNGHVAPTAQAAEPTDGKLDFVTVPRLTVPMADDNGNILGYVTLDLALQVVPDKAEYVKQRIPMIRHGLNALLYGGGNFGKAAQPEQMDIKRATPAMLKAANAALDEPVIKSLSVITALPS